MLVDGFLTFLDGTVVLTLANLSALLVANHIEWNQFCIVVLVTFLFLKVSVDKGLGAVEVSVIASIEGMPPA